MVDSLTTDRLIDSENAVQVSGLSIADLDGRLVLDAVDVQVPAGEVLGVVGESGSGKTTLGLSLLGWIRPGLQLAHGSVTVGGHRVLAADGPPAITEPSRLRGRVVAYVPQNPGRSLNPSMRVGDLLTSTLPRQRRTDRPTTRRAGLDLLAAVRLPTDPAFLRRWPHQLSGGQQQRLVMAIAIARRPSVMVLDEPTTGLDVITQQQVLGELRRLQRDFGLTMVYISHDLAVVSSLAGHILVMQNATVVEHGATAQVLQRPVQTYTRALLDAALDPRHTAPSADVDRDPDQPILQVRALTARHVGGGRSVVAADGVDLQLHRGECFALVGESGSGKTTTLRAIAGLHSPATGDLQLAGQQVPLQLRRRRRTDRRRIQLVLQNPLESLNPRQDVHTTLTRALAAARRGGLRSDLPTVDELLAMVALEPGLARRYPRALSGGQQQRVSIARALAARPEVLLCDEVTSALDVSVQAAVLELLDRLRRDTGIAILFVTHDLGVVGRIADRVAILDQGSIVESGRTADILAAPQHEYTTALLAAAPSLHRVSAGADKGQAAHVGRAPLPGEDALA
jgi:peptide/nickel transport system ATP-binding protein